MRLVRRAVLSGGTHSRNASGLTSTEKHYGMVMPARVIRWQRRVRGKMG